MRRFTKRQSPQQVRAEVAGLRWLSGAEEDGGARIVRVLEVEFGPDSAALHLEAVGPGRATPSAAEDLGRALARTHAAGAPWWGCPPEGLEGDGFIGTAPMTFLGREAAPKGWGEFYARVRVEPYVRTARDRGLFDARDVAVFDRLCSRLVDGRLDVPQPRLVGPGPARLHGDLWAGNVLWDPRGPEGCRAVLIDPAAHGGHAETDLAMLELFGLPYLDRVIAAYAEAGPFAPGRAERVALHQVYPLLVHTVLFGGSYARDAVRAARS